MSDNFNFRNPEPDEVKDLEKEVKRRRKLNIKYKLLADLLAGKEIDTTKNAEIFEAINREKMEFEQLLKLHSEQTRDAIEQTNIDRRFFNEGTWWNRNSKAKWGLKGHIPMCVYMARPKEYWKDEKLMNNFFNMFPKFRISSKPL